MTLLVLLFLMILNLLIIIVGCFILKLLPENHGLSLSDSLWESLKLILDPGGFLGSRLSAITTIVTSIIVLAGMVTFTGGIIGYVTNIITAKIDDSKNGTDNLNLTGVTLILNWNDRAMSIILDRLADMKSDNRNSYIVVLSTQDKQGLENYIAAKLKAFKYEHVSFNKHEPRIIIRNGDPKLPTELERVNCDDASRIFIVQPEGSTDPDYDVLKTYFSVAERTSALARTYEIMDENEQRALDAKVEYTTIVVETSDSQVARAVDAMALEPCGGHQYITSTLCNDLTLGKIYAQLALMPELVDTCNEILSMSGSTIAVFDVEEDAPSFGEMMNTLRYSIPLYGAVDVDGGQQRVYLTGEPTTEDVGFSFLPEEKVKLSHRDMVIDPDLGFDTHMLIIHGVNRKLPYILNAIRSNNACNGKRACKVRLIASKEQRTAAESIHAEYIDLMAGNLTIVSRDFEVGPMIDAIDDDLHSILVLAEDRDEPAKRDKNVFETWMGLVSAMARDEKLKGRLDGKVILELSSLDNAGLLDSSQHKLLVVSNQLTSLFMIQMSEGINIQDTLLDMLSTEQDHDFEELGIEVNSICDLMAIQVKKFFQKTDTATFISKQDCVDVVFRGTKRVYIPIGCVKGGSTYLFTNGRYADTALYLGNSGRSIDMSDAVLVCGDDNGVNVGEDGMPKEQLELDPDDFIVVVKREI